MLHHALQGAGELLLRPASLVSGAFPQAAVVSETEHRPWPLPTEPWFMGQTWLDLLFAHSPVEAEALRAVVPPQLPLDTFEGRTWLGVTPFLVRNLRPRGAPPAPWLSYFAEINVRTYVVVGGKPGIYFLSLDAASWPAVFAARRAYRLQRDGSLERWLTERYCLYALDERRRVYRGEINHPPWPLQPACAEFDTNTMARSFGLELAEEPLLHFSGRQDVALWPIRRIDAETLR